MLTQCINCQTVFRVTSTILRAAHGQVRCGKCNTQFDAIENLFEGEEDTSVAHRDGHDSQEQADTQFDAESMAHEDIVLEGNRIEISGVYRRPAVHLDDDQEIEAHTHTIIEQFNSDNGEWESPIAEDTEIDDDEPVEAELEDIEQEISAAQIADAMASLEPEHNVARNMGIDSEVTDHAQAESNTSLFIAEPVSSNTHNPIEDDLFGRTPSAHRWPWLVASISLIVLLTAQSIHHARAALARHPSIGPQITRLYAAIGQPLAPQWQLQAYSIKQWGIVSDPQATGTLRVRASVTNGATFAQPYPLLQLSLEDRFGGKVGMRTFKPEEYLSSQTLATRMLDAGESANIDLAIVDPGQDAVGFQFDTCLQLPNQAQHCTHDSPVVQP